ncbi:MAG: transcription-repair coupling factor [Planctomycetota bacterium]|nr:transcription-repair coupling factor [Planctomycetota bacterium]
MRTDHPHLDLIAQDPAVLALAERLAAGQHTSAIGAAGSSTAFVAAAVALRTGAPVVLVVAHLDDADEAADELSAAGIDAIRFPALEYLPGETAVSLELFAERLSVLRRLHASDLPAVLVCPVQALMQGVPPKARMDDLLLTLRAGLKIAPAALVRWLDAAGYKRLDAVEEPGDFAVRGGIVDIFPPGAIGDSEPSDAQGAQGAPDDSDAPPRPRSRPSGLSGFPVRVDFFGDEIESITEIDTATMGSGSRIAAVELVGALTPSAQQQDAGERSVLEALPRGACIAIIAELIEVTEQARGYYERVHDARGVFGPPAVMKLLRESSRALCEINQFTQTTSRDGSLIELPARPLPEISRDAAGAVRELAALSAEGLDITVLCQKEGELHRCRDLIAEFAPGAPVRSLTCYLHRGFIWERAGAARAAFVPYHELLHRYNTRRRIRRLKAGKATDAFLEIAPGDYVVHADHGIARFVSLQQIKPRAPKPTAEQHAEQLLAAVGAKNRKKPAGEPAAPSEEFLVLEFASRAKLHVPVSQIDKVQRYVGGHAGNPPLSTLGGKRWETQKDRVRESVRDLAAELLRVQAARQSMAGIRYPDDTAWQKEFEAEFPYQETEDQLACLQEIKKDMQRARPMDRLLCGDVGYGKTELAIRAAFKAVEFGRQVAVLVPTTLLAEQHERTFRERFAAYPFRIESLSRFKSRSEQNAVLAAARKGQVDVLIGTHRLLSKDVKFADLGLVVIDEEQRFGVEHKNTLLSLRLTVDVLTLSATPIPRTLHMSMLGLRDISSLTTAPLDRRAVVTEVLPYNEVRIRRAIERELSREGQVYFVHNRVHNINSVADDVQKLAPGARIVVGHGQMPEDELAQVMHAFLSRQADILVSTTIIESGIDIPTANTMIINNADRFGLAELHQLRGRVGRYKHRAYCYLLLPPDRPPTDVAVRRLRAIEEFSMLGAGFKIAMRDLEIRGAGNLLGAEQSGHIAAVGYDMYCRLLDSAARELRQEETAEPAETTIEIGLTGAVPKTYISSEQRRLEAYRRIGAARAPAEIAQIEADLASAYGPVPQPVRTALELASLRISARRLGVRSIALHEQDVIFRTADPDPVERALAAVQGTARRITPRPGEALTEIYYRPPPAYLEGPTLLAILRKVFPGGA